MLRREELHSRRLLAARAGEDGRRRRLGDPVAGRLCPVGAQSDLLHWRHVQQLQRHRDDIEGS